MQTGLIWIRGGYQGGSCNHGNEHLGSIKYAGIFWSKGLSLSHVLCCTVNKNEDCWMSELTMTHGDYPEFCSVVRHWVPWSAPKPGSDQLNYASWGIPGTDHDLAWCC